MSNRARRPPRYASARSRARRAGPLSELSGLLPLRFDDHDDAIVVTHYEWQGDEPWDLRSEQALAIATDQRAFGPDQLVVVTADREGSVLRVNHTDQTDPPEVALGCCLDAPGLDAAAAIAYSDEPVVEGPVTVELAERFVTARAVAALHRVHLVDWWMCGDDAYRSLKWSTSENPEWWDVP